MQDNYINQKSHDALVMGIDERVGDTGGQKQKFIENEIILYNSSNKLEKAKREALEMEGISLDINKQLNNQTEQLKGVNSKVNHLNTEIDESNDLLTKMKNRSYRNKMIIYGVSAVLTISLIAVLCASLI